MCCHSTAGPGMPACWLHRRSSPCAAIELLGLACLPAGCTGAPCATVAASSEACSLQGFLRWTMESVLDKLPSCSPTPLHTHSTLCRT